MAPRNEGRLHLVFHTEGKEFVLIAGNTCIDSRDVVREYSGLEECVHR